ncbi:unnamed protein product [Rotaria sordida]|uniref:G-protein coupled receptors family 1 profile domain-containing protein n=1 Tax=Rotaria sordida TaxID=392033 RepID=A0A815FYL8_9BILA|nr:unnamed protein product [Rotaria sordida]CAF3879657.1 unnamed protein product [Rotaria sordida]
MSSIDIRLNQINKAIPPILIVISLINFVFGGIGLILNVFVFTRASLRREPCSLYFFSSTLFNLFVIFVLIPVRIVSEGYNIDIGNYNLTICKIEFFAFYVARTIPCWLIVLACVDRYLNSSIKARIRQISSYKTARLAIGITIITIIILHIHMPVYYEISYMSDQFGNITPACFGQKGIYRTFIAFWAMVSYSLCPSFLMLFFGFLTLKNLHRHRQVLSRTTQINQTTRRVNIQLSRMLAAQVLVIVIATLPFSIYRLYASFTVSLPKSTLRIAEENLAFKIANVFTYFAHSTSFYLYTLTGTVFRKELFKIIRLRWYPNQTMVTMTGLKMQQMSILPSNRQITATNNNGT